MRPVGPGTAIAVTARCSRDGPDAVNWDDWLGSGTELTAGQMALRAVLVSLWVLVCIRVAGRRSFGQRGPLDACAAVLLGAVLSHAVLGSSPFLATFAGGLAIALVHRCLGWAMVVSPTIDRLIQGEARELYAHGRVVQRELRAALVSERDLRAEVSNKTGGSSLEAIDRAVLERNGQLTIVPQRHAHEQQGGQ